MAGGNVVNLNHIYPAVIVSYDRPSRTCRVKIEPLTNGAEEFIVAKLQNAIGDKAWHTEARILPDDLCYVMFENGDPRYPVITGYRTPEADNNVVEYRRWHHENIETDADQTQKHTAGETYRIEAGTSVTLLVGGSTIVVEDGKVTVTTQQFTVDAPESTFTGNVTINGDQRVDGGVSVGDDVVTDAGISHNDHPHTGNLGKDTSPPLPS